MIAEDAFAGVNWSNPLASRANVIILMLGNVYHKRNSSGVGVWESYVLISPCLGNIRFNKFLTPDHAARLELKSS